MYIIIHYNMSFFIICLMRITLLLIKRCVGLLKLIPVFVEFEIFLATD